MNYQGYIEEWLAPGESVEYREMACRVVHGDKCMFKGSLRDAYDWCMERRLDVINAKLNAIMLHQRGGEVSK